MQFTAPTATPRISESLFITTSMDDHDEEKRREQNLFVPSGKSEAKVTVITEDCARRIVLLKLTKLLTDTKHHFHL